MFHPKPKNMNTTITTIIATTILLLFFCSLVSCDSSPSLQDKCSPELTKLSECLAYAGAKADTPTTACCASAADMRQRNAVCLCFIIQQVHGGGSAIASLGLRFDRLVQLPAACKLPNSNVSDCPKLLNLPPSSPDYAIFSNTTKATTATTTTTNIPLGSSDANTKSTAAKQHIHFSGAIAIAAISAVSFFFFFAAVF